MKGKELVDSKAVVVKDLQDLAELLNDSGICVRGNLYSAIQDCEKRSTDDYYCYNLESFEFNSMYIAPPKVRPSGARAISLQLSMQVKGKYISNVLSDPFLDFILSDNDPPSFNLELFAKNETGEDLYSAWHFDKHFVNDGDGQVKYCHPLYHWTFGGKNMDLVDSGSVLLLPTPRIAHPPFDAVLAIDYIIKHYIRFEDHQALTEDTKYTNIVGRSQERIWKPYILTLASFWTENVNSGNLFSAQMLMPELTRIK